MAHSRDSQGPSPATPGRPQRQYSAQPREPRGDRNGPARTVLRQSPRTRPIAPTDKTPGSPAEDKTPSLGSDSSAKGAVGQPRRSTLPCESIPGPQPRSSPIARADRLLGAIHL